MQYKKTTNWLRLSIGLLVLLIGSCSKPIEPYIVPRAEEDIARDPSLRQKTDLDLLSFSGEVLGIPLNFDSRNDPKQVVLNDFFLSTTTDPTNPRPPTVEIWSNISRLAVAGRREALWRFDLFFPSIPRADFSAKSWGQLFSLGEKQLWDQPNSERGLARKTYGLLFQVSDFKITGVQGELNFYLRDEPGTVFRVLKESNIPILPGWEAAKEVTFLIDGTLYEVGTNRKAGQIKNAQLTTRFSFRDFD